MGLLDVLNSDEGRMGLALLAAGAPRLDGAGFGQRLNEAVGSFDQYKSGQDAASFKKLQADALRQELLGRQNAATEAARLRGLMQSDMSYQDMVRQGVPVEQVKALAESRNFGRDEVARTTEIEGPGGQKIIQGFDKFNNPIGAGVAGYVAPQLVNQGDRQAFVKPSAGLSLPVGMSPSERDASARGWASNNLAAQRFAFEQAGGAEANKPQLVDGQWIYKPSAQNPQGMVVPVAGIADKPLTESQGAAVMFGQRAAQADSILRNLESKGEGQPGTIKRVAQAMTPGLGMGLDESVGTLTNFTQSKIQQSAEQAQNNFLTAILRKESGASISPSEFATARKMYFAQPGDSAAILEQKQQTRADAISGMKAQAGQGAKHIADQSGIPQSAVSHLKMVKNDPKALAEFDQVFGDGAAARVLRGK